MTEPPREKTSLTEIPGAVISGVLGGLSGQPILIVIVVMNVIMVGSLIWGAAEVAKGRSEIIDKLIDRCGTGMRSGMDMLLAPPVVKPQEIRQ